MDHQFLVAALLHGQFKLFFHILQSGLRIGGGLVFYMGLPDIPDNAIQIVMEDVLKKSLSCTCPSSNVRI